MGLSFLFPLQGVRRLVRRIPRALLWAESCQSVGLKTGAEGASPIVDRANARVVEFESESGQGQ